MWDCCSFACVVVQREHAAIQENRREREATLIKEIESQHPITQF